MVVVRLFNTVGPRQTGRYGMVLPTFVRQALHGEPLTVYGDGTQSRCFCHVSDVVEGLLRLADDSSTDGEVFNIGSDEEVTIEGLADRVRELTASSSEIVRVPYSEAYGEGFEDMTRRVPDLGKISERVGYECSHTLVDIIESVIEYEKQRVPDVAPPASSS